MDLDIPDRAEKATPSEVGGFAVYPKGDYEAMLTKLSLGSSDKCGGQYYQWEVTFVTGEYRGKTLTMMWTFNNPIDQFRNETDVMYANVKAAIGYVPTAGQKPRTDDFLNKPFKMTLDCYKSKTGETKNKITNILPRHSGPTAQSVAPQESASVKPW